MEELKKIIVELNSVFEELIPIEKNKLTAAADHNVVELEECMKREQAAVLQIRGLDQKREAWLAQKGWSDKSFRQILEFLPGEERGQLEPSFERMTENFRMFRKVNEDTNMVLKTNLRVVENLTGKNGPYSPEGTQQEKERHFTSRKA